MKLYLFPPSENFESFEKRRLFFDKGEKGFSASEHFPEIKRPKTNNRLNPKGAKMQGRQIFNKMMDKNKGAVINPTETDAARAMRSTRKLANTLAKLEASAASAGVNIDSIKNKGLRKVFGPLKDLLGPTSAVLLLDNINRAPNKKDALIQTAVGLGSFSFGFNTMQKYLALGSKMNPDPRLFFRSGSKGNVYVSVMAGLLAAYGISQPVGTFLKKNLPKFTGEQQMTGEIVSFFEKQTKRSFSRLFMESAAKGVVKKGMERTALNSLSKVLSRKIEGSFMKKIMQMTSGPIASQVMKMLGAKGALVGALLADDTTVIGVLDDVVAVGLTAWMAKDVYDVSVLIYKAFQVKAEMKMRQEKPISSIFPARKKDQLALQAALSARGKKVEDLSPDQLMQVVQGIADIKILIKRKGLNGYEEYRYVKGEVWSTTIKTHKGEILTMSDKELNQTVPYAPPKNFKPWNIDYNQPKEKIMAHCRLALFKIKAEAGWTKMDFKVVDDKTIELKRFDNNQQVTLKRNGSNWQVYPYRSGLNLFQAAALGNLLNKVAGIMTKEKHSGGSKRPFELDGNNIDFDRNWNPIDLRVIASSGGWIHFYQKMGLKPGAIVTVLNDWWEANEAVKRSRTVQYDDTYFPPPMSGDLLF